MKALHLLIALALVIPATAIAVSAEMAGVSGTFGPHLSPKLTTGRTVGAQVTATGGVDQTGTTAISSQRLTQVAIFENGTRYQAGSYPVVVLSGSYREMGRQYGALMKNELQAEYSWLIANLTGRGYNLETLRNDARQMTALQPKRMKELTAGMAETTNLTEEDLELLYEGPIFFIALKKLTPGCSFLAAWGDYTRDGSVVLSRNYDLPDLLADFNQYYTLAVYNPTDGSNGVATFGPAGSRPETLMNSAGLFIADDNAAASAGEVSIAGRPDLISEFFRLMLDYSDMEGLDAGIGSLRPDVGWIVNAGSSERAYSYEETTYDTKRREGDGVIAAANHFVDPSWRLGAPSPEHSTTRYNNLISLAEKHRGAIDGEEMVTIRDVLLKDGGATFRHDLLEGYPYSSTHQVTFVPKSRTLWIKVVDRDWQKVELGPLFALR
jgi:hypothetical protein